MKIVPASRVPRRLPMVISTMATTATSTRYGYSVGKVAVIAAVPAAIETATVRV